MCQIYFLKITLLSTTQVCLNTVTSAGHTSVDIVASAKLDT